MIRIFRLQIIDRDRAVDLLFVREMQKEMLLRYVVFRASISSVRMPGLSRPLTLMSSTSALRRIEIAFSHPIRFSICNFD